MEARTQIGFLKVVERSREKDFGERGTKKERVGGLIFWRSSSESHLRRSCLAKGTTT